MGKKVIAAGHICLDITPVFSKAGKKTMSSILQPGKLIQMKGVDVHTGGSVANTGLAMKILGADVTLMGKIGKDAFGDMIHNILKEYKAEKGMLVMEGDLLLIPLFLLFRELTGFFYIIQVQMIPFRQMMFHRKNWKTLLCSTLAIRH